MQIEHANINAMGQVVGYGFHDATVVGLRYDKDGDLVVRIRRLDGSAAGLRLQRVGDVGTNGFRAPAIISDVYAWDPVKTPDDATHQEDGVWCVLFANQLRSDTLSREILRVSKEGRFKYVVLVACSFGGALAALCEAIAVEEESTM